MGRKSSVLFEFQGFRCQAQWWRGDNVGLFCSNRNWELQTKAWPKWVSRQQQIITEQLQKEKNEGDIKQCQGPDLNSTVDLKNYVPSNAQKSQ